MQLLKVVCLPGTISIHSFCVPARKLRSADAAFELLESFKSIKSRGAIRKQMMNKMNDILLQFRREIDTTTAIFHTLKVRRYAIPIVVARRLACLLVAHETQDSFVFTRNCQGAVGHDHNQIDWPQRI